MNTIGLEREKEMMGAEETEAEDTVVTTYVFEPKSLADTDRKLSLNEIKRLLGVPLERETEKVSINKAQAKRLMKTNNDHNRKISTKHVMKLKMSMDEGRWVWGADSIAFDYSGTITNGQHRLAAFINSNMTHLVVTVNFGTNHHMDMDTAKARSFRDNVCLSDDADDFLKEHGEVLDVISAYVRICTGKYSNVKLLQQQLIEIGNNMVDDIKRCHLAGLMTKTNRTGTSPIRASYLLAAQSGVDIDLLAQIKTALDKGVCSGDYVDSYSSSIIKVRDRLMQLSGSGSDVLVQRVFLVQSLIDKISKGESFSYIKVNKASAAETSFKYKASGVPYIKCTLKEKEKELEKR